jgi:hypothetical protein
VDIPANVLIPAAAGILGALAGSIAPVIVSLLQQRGEHRRERLRLAVQLAVEENKMILEQIKMQPGNYTVLPMSAQIVYFVDVLDLVARGKEITPDVVAGISQRALSIVTPSRTTPQR